MIGCHGFVHKKWNFLTQIFAILVFNILVPPCEERCQPKADRIPTCSISASLQYTQLGTRPAFGRPRSSQGSTRNYWIFRGISGNPAILLKRPPWTGGPAVHYFMERRSGLRSLRFSDRRSACGPTFGTGGPDRRSFRTAGPIL